MEKVPMSVLVLETLAAILILIASKLLANLARKELATSDQNNMKAISILIAGCGSCILAIVEAHFFQLQPALAFLFFCIQWLVAIGIGAIYREEK